METTKGQKLAEDHWRWLERQLRLQYIDAFVHGYKHGVEDTEERTDGDN